jgi:hypothetical protein
MDHFAVNNTHINRSNIERSSVRTLGLVEFSNLSCIWTPSKSQPVSVLNHTLALGKLHDLNVRAYYLCSSFTRLSSPPKRFPSRRQCGVNLSFIDPPFSLCSQLMSISQDHCAFFVSSLIRLCYSGNQLLTDVGGIEGHCVN